MKVLDLHKLSLFKQKAFIGGKWVSALSGKMYPVLNPSTNKVICDVPDMNHEETKLAINAAHNAFHSWKKTTAKERAGILRRWYDLTVKHTEELAQILTAEAGKPLVEARGEIAYGASFLEWFSEEARRIYGEVLQSPFPNKEMILIKEPIGVTGLITPWNFPNAMLARKAGAALAAGCTCVAKPAEDTPLSALALAALAEEAGMPEGVFNVVTGSRANAPSIGNTICESKQVAGVSFTGSTAVGKLLYKQSSSSLKHIGLELGGNAPFIVFDSAKVNVAVDGLMGAKFRNSGQTCVSANRIFVQSGIYEEFVSALKTAVTTKLKVGDGFEEGVNIGPLINHSQLQKVEKIVEDSVKQGAKALIGGKKHALGGLFFEPSLLVDCDIHTACFAEEIFGPVIAIKKFNTEEEVMNLANHTDMGLAAYFFSQDPAQIFRVARNLEAGMVGVNEGLISAAEGAFGGTKESGLGREGSRHGIEDFTHIKYICIGDMKQ